MFCQIVQSFLIILFVMAKGVIFMKNTFTDVNLGDRYRNLRKDRKLTQDDLAQYLGLTRSAINTWEQGLSIPSVNMIISLSQFYGVTTDYLLGLDNADLVDITNLSSSDRVLVHDLVKRLSIPTKKTKRETAIIKETLANGITRGRKITTEQIDDENI